MDLDELLMYLDDEEGSPVRTGAGWTPSFNEAMSAYRQKLTG